MKIVGLIRVSTERQENEGASLSAQLRLTVEPGVASIPVPQTPARQAR